MLKLIFEKYSGVFHSPSISNKEGRVLRQALGLGNVCQS